MQGRRKEFLKGGSFKLGVFQKVLFALISSVTLYTGNV